MIEPQASGTGLRVGETGRDDGRNVVVIGTFITSEGEGLINQ